MLSGIKNRFNFAVISSVLVILLTAFEWSLVDTITIFLMLPLSAAVWLFFIGCMIASLTCVLNFKRIGRKSVAPIGIQLVALLLVIYVPFTALWLKADYILNKAQREVVVAKVLNGQLKPNVEYNTGSIHLSGDDSGVSRGGDDIVVETHDGRTYVFFFTFRGILDNYSGYLYVPEGGSAEKYSDLNEADVTQIKHIEHNWYLVSHH